MSLGLSWLPNMVVWRMDCFNVFAMLEFAVDHHTAKE
jgi:hypothetical protein